MTLQFNPLVKKGFDESQSLVDLDARYTRKKTTATKTEDYTITSSDGTIIVDASSNTVTITLPTAVGINGTSYMIKCIDDTFTVTVDTDGAETIDAELTQTLNQNDNISIVSDGANWIII